MNARVAERIAQPDRLSELHGEMVDGDLYGMQSFDQSLVRLYQGGLVTRADVLAHAGEPSEMKFELDRADFERGGAPSYPVAEPSGPQAPTPNAQHDPGDPLPHRVHA